MGTLIMILSVVLVVMSLVLLIAVPVAGIIGIAIGVVLFLYGRKYNKEKKAAAEQIERTMQTDIHEFKIAGFDYRQAELEQLFETPNEDYLLNGKAFAEEVLDKAYEFLTEWKSARIVYEPENEYDPNAIAVYVGETKIGYIQKKDQTRFNNLPPGEMEVELYGGRYKEAVYDDYGEFEKIEKGETPYKAMLYVKCQ